MFGQSLILSNATGEVQQLSKEQTAAVLTGDPISSGYRPTLPVAGMWEDGGGPRFYIYRDIEAMLTHPAVLDPLRTYKAGISGAEFEFEASSQEVLHFGAKEWERFWTNAVNDVRRSTEYGWLGGELVYKEEKGKLGFDELLPFAARDTNVLVCRNQYAGVRVRNAGRIQVDLWGPDGGLIEDVDALTGRGIGNGDQRYDPGSARGSRKVMVPRKIPAKGFWFAHNPRDSKWYGQSQALGAWRPWRRLASADGTEYVIDAACYRFGVAGPRVFYPEEDRRAPGGNVIIARDKARELAENLKANMAVAVPSTCYPPEQGGKEKWRIETPDRVIDVGPLSEREKQLWRQCSFGVGVSPDITQGSEVGSGYSGRAIPFEAYMQTQQADLNAIIKAWHDQVGEPVIQWNFGPGAWFRVKAKNLLETKMKATGDRQQQPGEKPQQPGAAQPPKEPGGNGFGGFKPRTPQPSGNGNGRFSLGGGRPTRKGPRGGTYYLNEHDEKVYTGETGGGKAVAEHDEPADEHANAFKALAAFGASVEHKIKGKIRDRVDRLPAILRLPVIGVYRLFTVTYSAGQAAAREVALQVGGQEYAERVGRIVAAVDILAAEPGKYGVIAAGFPAIGAALAFAPLGSLSYLAFSTAKNPVATIKAAKSLIRKVKAKVGSSTQLSLGEDAEPIAALLAGFGQHDPDWYEALVFAALDESSSMDEAVELANAAAQQSANMQLSLSQDELIEASAAIDPEPSEAQKKSGNYRKGHVRWKGLDITLENAKGGVRSGVGKDGEPWQTEMHDAYGYFKRTESEADGDHIDVFLCDEDLDSDIVFVVNQLDGDGVGFDEHKVVAGAKSTEQAEQVYRRNYSADWQGFGGIVAMTLPEFAAWLKDGDTGIPVESVALSFKESEHPRGQPENAGQFIASDGAGGAKKTEGLADKVKSAKKRKEVVQALAAHGKQLAKDEAARIKVDTAGLDAALKEIKPPWVRSMRKTKRELSQQFRQYVREYASQVRQEYDLAVSSDEMHSGTRADVAAMLGKFGKNAALEAWEMSIGEEFDNALYEAMIDDLTDPFSKAYTSAETLEQAKERVVKLAGTDAVLAGTDIKEDDPWEDDLGDAVLAWLDTGPFKEVADKLRDWLKKAVLGDKEPDNEYVGPMSNIPKGESRHVAGWYVKRTGPDEYRIETDNGHIAGPPEKVAERIRREWADQLPDKKRIDEALARAAAHTGPDFFSDPAKHESEAEAFQALPSGTRVVSLDPATRGRTGSIVRTVEYRAGKDMPVNRVKLDGSPELVGSNIEPLDEKQSWRVEREESAPEPLPEQKTLFSTAKDEGQWIMGNVKPAAIASIRLSALSDDIEPAVVGDMADPVVEEILERATKHLNELTEQARADLLDRITNTDPHTAMMAARQTVDEYAPLLAAALTELQIASVLAGMRKVANRLPAVPFTFEVATLPATLAPDEATDLLEEIRVLTPTGREEKADELPAEQAAWVRQTIEAQLPPPVPPMESRIDFEEPERPKVEFPIIDEAVRDLSERRLLTRADYDELTAEAKREAFTIAGVESEATLEKVRDLLAEQVEQGADLQEWKEKIVATVGEGTFLSPNHMGQVYRNAVQTSLSEGQQAVLEHPIVEPGFPYRGYFCIHDDRVRPNHLALEKLGLNGTNVYRADDPTWKKFQPPWDWSDRCGWTGLSVRQAASMGVKEAQAWLESGREPTVPEWVTPPPFNPPQGWNRESVALSLTAFRKQQKG